MLSAIAGSLPEPPTSVHRVDSMMIAAAPVTTLPAPQGPQQPPAALSVLCSFRADGPASGRVRVRVVGASAADAQGTGRLRERQLRVETLKREACQLKRQSSVEKAMIKMREARTLQFRAKNADFLSLAIADRLQ